MNEGKFEQKQHETVKDSHILSLYNLLEKTGFIKSFIIKLYYMEGFQMIPLATFYAKND